MPTPRRHNLRQHTRAFTLIEILVVMLLIGIIAAMIVPSLRAFSAGRANHFAATQFLAELRYARTQSVADGKAYRVIIDPAAGEFYVAADDGTGNFVAIPHDLGRRIALQDGVRLDSDLPQRDGVTCVEFRPNGAADPGKISFINKAGESVTLVCESASEQYHEEGK